MSSRKFRGILAVATLTAGVSWMTAGPTAAHASAAWDACTGSSPASTVRVCDDSTDLVALDGPQGGKTVRPVGDRATDRLIMAAVRLANRLGVAGLATGHSVMAIADQGGMAATAGAGTLPGGIPGTAGLADVSRLAEEPGHLPMLRRLPRTGELPVNMPDAATTTPPRGSRIAGTGAGLSSNRASHPWGATHPRK